MFFSVVREGVADKPGKILCSFFLFCSGGLGLAWEPGGAGILFFFTGILWKGIFFGRNPGFFCLSICSPIKKPAYFFYENAGLSSCAGDQT